jgi:hypothetical protein
MRSSSRGRPAVDVLVGLIASGSIGNASTAGPGRIGYSAAARTPAIGVSSASDE